MMHDKPSPEKPSSAAPAMQKSRTPRRITFNRLIPNVLTLLALCAGMSAIRFAFETRWEMATAAVAVAAILDALDGRMARLLNGASQFGAELDSLADCLSFGIAPAFILYQWSLSTLNPSAWIIALILACCCAMRLARFNTMSGDASEPAWKKFFFIGTPAPAGAGLALFPLVLWLQWPQLDFLRAPELVSITTLLVSGLFISKVPTISLKHIKISPAWFMPVMVMIAVLIALTFTRPWVALTVVLGVYILSIPFGIIRYARLQREHM